MRRTLWITAGCLLFGCGGDDSTATSEDTGTSESSDDGDDPVVVDDSSSGGETTTTGIDPDTSSGAAESSSTTGAVELCGNGEMDPGELCDDGNTEDGDACSAACAPTFELLWTLSYDGESSSIDYGNDVLVGPDDSIYVLGGTRIAGQRDVWLQQILPDGTLGWQLVWGGEDLLDDSGTAMAWTADGDLAITGYTESIATGADILVLVVDLETQTEIWHETIDGPGSGPGDNDDFDDGSAIAIDPDGNLVVAGQVRIGPQDWDIWLGELTADGTMLRWEQTYTGALGESDGPQSLAIDDAGGVELLAFQDAPTDATPLVLFYDGEGMPMPADTVMPETWANDFVRIADGHALVGNHEPANTLLDIRTWVVDATWTETWSADYDGAGHDVDIGEAIAVGPAGEVVVAGYEIFGNEQANAWVGAYRADGTPWWSDSYNNDEANLSDSYDAVAIDSAGDVIVVGAETVLGQQDNAFVRKYHPL